MKLQLGRGWNMPRWPEDRRCQMRPHGPGLFVAAAVPEGVSALPGGRPLPQIWWRMRLDKTKKYEVTAYQNTSARITTSISTFSRICSFLDTQIEVTNVHKTASISERTLVAHPYSSYNI